MTTAMQISRNRVQQLDEMGLFYCNELPWRCSNPRCRDCSTAVADILNASGANVNRCSTSFSLAEWCYNASRPEWFSELHGRNLPGTFIPLSSALHTPCIGLSGSNWGKNADSNGHGHVEYIPGEGALSWGAHSHATGVGYDADGIYTHSLDFFAVPPHFLPWMVPPPKIDWEYLKEVETWAEHVSGPREVDKKGNRIRGTLKRGDHGHDVLMAKQILHAKGYLNAVNGDGYGWRMSGGVKHWKTRNGWPKKQRNGDEFGSMMVNSLLK